INSIREQPCGSGRWTELNGGKELGEAGLGFGPHADEDDEGDEAVVRDHLRVLHGPSAPLTHQLRRTRRGRLRCLRWGLPLLHGRFCQSRRREKNDLEFWIL
uniref:Uncharacterized protein n=1 Tax=Triticum urartu TaxID=4572 RepID=A0A8R7PUK1_TRIUA